MTERPFTRMIFGLYNDGPVGFHFAEVIGPVRALESNAAGSGKVSRDEPSQFGSSCSLSNLGRINEIDATVGGIHNHAPVCLYVGAYVARDTTLGASRRDQPVSCSLHRAIGRASWLRDFG